MTASSRGRSRWTIWQTRAIDMTVVVHEAMAKRDDNGERGDTSGYVGRGPARQPERLTDQDEVAFDGGAYQQIVSVCVLLQPGDVPLQELSSPPRVPEQRGRVRHRAGTAP